MLAVAQSLMDNLVRQYGINRGVHVYNEMVRNELGPFAPGNKYGRPLDDA